MADADNAIPLAACVFNAFLSYTTIMLNVITIHALRKASGLQKNLKTWLLSMSVADLGVGLLAQPLYITLNAMGMNQTENKNIFNKTRKASIIVTNVLCLASFLVVAAVAFDRFLAIYLHLRYQEIVTHNRVVAVVISFWVLSAFFSLLSLLLLTKTVFEMIVIICSICLIVAALFYFKIYLVVRHHAQQISALHAEQVAQNDEQMAIAARQKKSTVAVFYVYLVLLVCYLPNMGVIVIFLTGQYNKIPLNMAFFTDALVFLNSTLNPLIYCWKMRPVQQAIINILQNIYR